MAWFPSRERISAFTDVGLSKFVVRPAAPAAGAASFEDFAEGFARELMPLQT
jgi:hypothetical protein